MQPERTVVGRTYPEVRFAIEREGVERFARAVGDDANRGVPPTYAAVYALHSTVPQLFLDEDAAVDFAHLVHGEQEFQWTRHPEIGETVFAQGTVTDDKRTRGMRFLTFETVCRDERGGEVCRSRMLSIIRATG